MRVKLTCVLILALTLTTFVVPAQGQCKRGTPFSERALRGRALKTVVPQYPEEAVKRRAKGKVVVKVVVNEEGGVNSVEVIESPDDSLKEAVVDAVKQWRFQETLLSGQPICVTGRLTFKFMTKGDKGQVKDAPDGR